MTLYGSTCSFAGVIQYTNIPDFFNFNLSKNITFETLFQATKVVFLILSKVDF